MEQIKGMNQNPVQILIDVLVVIAEMLAFQRIVDGTAMISFAFIDFGFDDLSDFIP